MLTENVTVRSDVVPHSQKKCECEEWYCALLTENVTVRGEIVPTYKRTV